MSAEVMSWAMKAPVSSPSQRLVLMMLGDSVRSFNDEGSIDLHRLKSLAVMKEGELYSQLVLLERNRLIAWLLDGDTVRYRIHRDRGAFPETQETQVP